jgi:DNA-directed RNA polymerase specialized sigma24 family protein
MNELIQHQTEIVDARLVLRYCAGSLSRVERAALFLYLSEAPERTAAASAGVSRAAIWYARQRAFAKMRRKLNALGISSSHDLFSVIDLGGGEP